MGAVLVSTACGATPVSDGAVAAHAQWLCDVPRFSYQDASEPASRLDEILARAGVTEDEYDALVTSLDNDEAARSRVATEYHQSCGES